VAVRNRPTCNPYTSLGSDDFVIARERRTPLRVPAFLYGKDVL
jgi:hypothetical protein